MVSASKLLRSRKQDTIFITELGIFGGGAGIRQRRTSRAGNVEALKLLPRHGCTLRHQGGGANGCPPWLRLLAPAVLGAGIATVFSVAILL